MSVDIAMRITGIQAVRPHPPPGVTELRDFISRQSDATTPQFPLFKFEFYGMNLIPDFDSVQRCSLVRKFAHGFAEFYDIDQEAEFILDSVARGFKILNDQKMLLQFIVATTKVRWSMTKPLLGCLFETQFTWSFYKASAQPTTG